MNQTPSPFFRKFMIVFASVICVFYLAYRAIYTFNLATPYAVFASVFLYVGEFFGIMNLLLYFLQVWEVSEPPAEPVLEGRTVDVLVPTYNEDPALLRATLEACIRMDYPHKTFVLDDGRRPEVEALAKELGVIYISRPDNRHAKAGNLNNALEQTDGEFVVVLDADHVPEPHFITRLIGYFRDDYVAFVQTPHAFYNFDSFQARLDHKNRRYWEEGDLFYRVIQPGRNKWNAPIFAGSAAMFRRTALREIGYIATETITEDMHTGLRLHARGWKSIAISERLVAGQAPPDIKTFHAQRLRWGEGNLSIMAYDNPLIARGLTAPQRLCYFGSMIHWASGLFKLAIYLTPIMMLFSGVPPVREFTWDLIVVTLVYLFFSLYAMKVVSNGYGSIVNSELFSMVNFWTQIKATFRAIFRRQRQRFVVTPKGRASQKSVWPYVRPQTYLIILSVLAIFWGWLRLNLDLNPIRALARLLYEIHLEATISAGNAIMRLIDGTVLNHPITVGFGISDDYLKPVVPTIWCLIFFWIAYKVTQRAFWPGDRRFAVRHQIHLPVEYEMVDNQGTSIHYGVTVDLNDSGMAFVAYSELPLNGVFRFTVRGAGEVVKCKGEIRSAALVARGPNSTGHRYGVQFLNLTPPQIDAINRMCLHYAVPRMFAEYDRGNRDTFWNRIKQWQSRGMAQRRVAKRNNFSMPIIVNTGTTEETTHFSATEDISRVATAAMFDTEIPPGSRVGYLLPTPLGDVRGTAHVLRSAPVKIAGRNFYRTVLEFQEFEGQGRTTIQSLVNPNEHGPLGAVLKPDRRTFLPKMKLPILVGLLIALPLILAQMVVIFPFYYKDDETLKKMIDERRAERVNGERVSYSTANENEMREYKRIFAETMKEPRTAPTDRLVLLMNLGNELLPPKSEPDPNNIRQDLEQVTLYLAVRDPANMGLSTALVHAYRNTGKYAEAEREYNRLVALSERGKLTADRLQEVKLAGARVAVDSENYPLAIERFSKLFEADPRDQDLRNEYAGVCIRGGQVETAIKLITGGPIDLTGRKLLIAAYMKEKNYPKASAEVRKLAAETNNSEEALLLQADIERESKAFDSEINTLTQLRDKQKSKDPKTLVMLAQAMVNRATYDTSEAKSDKKNIDYYEEALSILYPLLQREPIPEGALNVFVEAASKVPGIESGLPGFNQEKHDRIKKQALALYQPAYDSTSTAPEHAIYLTRLGWLLQRVGEGNRSSILVKRAFDIRPADDNIRQQLAGLLLAQGRTREALEILSTNGSSREARKLFWGILVERREFDKALDVARSLAETADREQKWAAEKDVADILSWKGDYTEALSIYEKHIHEKGEDEETAARIAEINLWAKRYGDAMAGYEKLLTTGPKARLDKYGDAFINAAAGATASVRLTKAQMKLIDELAAQKLKSTAKPEEPEKILALSRLAWIMLNQNQRETANTILDKLKDVKKSMLNPDGRKEVAGVLTHAGRFRDAIQLLDNPKTNEERMGMAKMYTGAREWQQAETLLQEIIDSKPDESMLKAARIMKADVLSYKGEHEKAIAEFKQLRMEYADDPDLPIREAEVTLWSKQYDQALALFQELYDKNPTNPKVWTGYVSAVAALGAYNAAKIPKVKVFVPAAYRPALASIAKRVTDDPAADPLLLSRLALAMKYVGEPLKAEMFADRAYAMNPPDVVSRRDLANTYSALAVGMEPKRAHVLYQRAIDLFVSVEMTDDDRRRLIDIATAGEQMDVALREARYLVNKDPSSRKDRRLLAEVLSWRGDFAESLKVYEDLMRDQKKDKDDLLVQMAQVTVWWKHYPEALIRYGELIDRKLEEPRILFGFIDAASSAPSISPEHARQCKLIYEKVKNDLKETERLSRLAWIMIKLNEVAKADPLLERAMANVLARTTEPDPDADKELAGVLTARLFPKDPVEPEPGIKPVTRKWLINSAIYLYKGLNLDDFDTATRLNYITLLIASETQENIELAESILEPMYRTGPKEDAPLKIRYGEVLLWAGKYDSKGAKYRAAQKVFKQIIADIKDDASPWKELAKIRLGQSYLWAHEYDLALPIFEDLLSRELVEKEKSRERDIWMGYIDSLAGRVGEKFRLARNDDDLDRIRQGLYSPEQRRLIVGAYGKLAEMKPDPRYAEGDPEYYNELLDYYAGTASRLSMELEYMNERQRARIAHDRAVISTPERVNKLKLWNEYARTLMNVKAYQQAGSIMESLLKDELPAGR